MELCRAIYIRIVISYTLPNSQPVHMGNVTIDGFKRVTYVQDTGYLGAWLNMHMAIYSNIITYSTLDNSQQCW